MCRHYKQKVIVLVDHFWVLTQPQSAILLTVSAAMNWEMPAWLNTAWQNVCSGSWTLTSHFSLSSETCCEVTQTGHTGPSRSAVAREITSGTEAASPRHSVGLTSDTTLLCLKQPPSSALSSTLSQRWHAIYTFFSHHCYDKPYSLSRA